jgi:UDP-hydrolysing UDP-N-acetyl-D-glucosamine 2-epimerase
MMKRKICVLVTARPSYARIKSALRAIQDHPQLELQLIVAGSALLDRYGSAIKVMQADGFTVQGKVFMILEGENLVTSAKSTGLGLMELATTFDNLQPDIVVTVADRYETLATAVAASYMNIPLVHIQGGEVTGSIDEKVRHAVTKLADIHFVASEKSRERVIRMGEVPETVYLTGCPSVDLAADVLRSPMMGFDPIAKYGGVGTALDLSKGYLVVLQHPVTTEYVESRTQIHETVEAVMELGLPILWFWPNVDAGSDGVSKGLRAYREQHRDIPIHFFKNMTPEDFLRLLIGSQCLIGNSSVGIRECSYLGVPVVNIGSRQRGRERGCNVIDVPYDRNKIREAVMTQISRTRPVQEQIYGDGTAGQRIAHLLATAPLRVEKILNY